jgi:hypothetical protein
VDGGDGALDEEPALPSSLMPDPLKGTKLGSAGSGSDVLSAHTHMMSSIADTTSSVQRHRQYVGSSFTSVWMMKTISAVAFFVLPQCDNLLGVIVELCDVPTTANMACLLSSDNTTAFTLCYHSLLKV